MCMYTYVYVHEYVYECVHLFIWIMFLSIPLRRKILRKEREEFRGEVEKMVNFCNKCIISVIKYLVGQKVCYEKTWTKFLANICSFYWKRIRNECFERMQLPQKINIIVIIHRKMFKDMSFHYYLSMILVFKTWWELRKSEEFIVSYKTLKILRFR